MGADAGVLTPVWPAAVTDVVFPRRRYDELLGHARRKLIGEWLAGEEQAPKAYGLVAGRITGRRALVTHVVPLRNNQRDRPELKGEIDRLMREVAVPSETPMERRGWVADPREVLAAERLCDSTGSMLLGAYHMHRVPWAHDPVRDTCTLLDRRLAEGSGMWTLILSMVDPEHPILRAFFEGDNAREARIRVQP